MKTPLQISIMLSIPDKLNRRRSAMLTSNYNSSLTKISVFVMLLLLTSLSATMVFAQEPPLVFDQENTGANLPQPTRRETLGLGMSKSVPMNSHS